MAGAMDPSDAASAARKTVRQFEGLLLDYVGGILSEMDDRSFLLSCGSCSGSDGEVGDGGEDGGGVEQGLIIAGR
jgi:hypothetical protein